MLEIETKKETFAEGGRNRFDKRLSGSRKMSAKIIYIFLNRFYNYLL